MNKAQEQVKIRPYQKSDYQGIVSVIRDCYAGIDDNCASIEEVQLLCESFPEGQIIACIGNEIVGLIFSLLVRYEDFVRAPKLEDMYNPLLFKEKGKNGNSLFALEILVHSNHKRKGIGKLLNQGITKVLKNNNLKAFIGVSRLSGYGALQDKMSVETYIKKVVNGEITDPSLTYNCQNKMLPKMAIAQYYPPDIASAGYGALVVQENPFYNDNVFQPLLEEKSVFVKLPKHSLLSEEEHKTLLNNLKTTPYTFEYEPMPSCWGKAFENYLTMEDYFAPHALDEKIAEWCKPILSKIEQMLKKQGIKVEVLKDFKTNQPYTTGDFRIAKIEPFSTMLHLDDLKMDGRLKPDFELPMVLQENPYLQFSVLVHLADKGNQTTLRMYHKKYTESDNQFLLENGWQFSDKAVEGADYTDYQPKIGDAFIMNNQHFHDILNTEIENEWCVYSTYILYVPNKQTAYLYI